MNPAHSVAHRSLSKVPPEPSGEFRHPGDRKNFERAETFLAAAVNGVGIPPEILARVFDRLVTDPGKAGTGFGLAIVKQIVEAHGGVVSAESTHGAGATFRFSLPASQEN